jgi:1,4-dihydroxy-2-naphthoate octaprenyltransferase
VPGGDRIKEKYWENEMKKNQVIATLMFILVIGFILGLVLEIHKYWFILDFLVIIICGISGIMLLIEKKDSK